jgi:hypothetical protein
VSRFWLQCCLGHSQHQKHEDKGRLLRELGKFRRALLGLIMRMKVSKTVHLLNPLEVLNVADSVTDIESVMLDQVHLLSGCYDMIADEAGRIVEGWKTGKCFPDDKIQPDAKSHKTGAPGGGKKGGGRGKKSGFKPGFKSGGYGGYAGTKKW